eukprot:3845497-Pleurochrysis_carterae.AAC.1
MSRRARPCPPMSARAPMRMRSCVRVCTCRDGLRHAKHTGVEVPCVLMYSTCFSPPICESASTVRSAGLSRDSQSQG